MRMNIGLLSKERVLYLGKEESLSYKHGALIYRNRDYKQKCKIGGLLTCATFFERLLRLEPRCSVRIDSNTFLVSCSGMVLRYEVNQNHAYKEMEYKKGMRNPLSFLSLSDDGSQENRVFFGEYVWNEAKGPVSIYERTGPTWKIVYTFPPNTITHIHALYYDKYRDGFIILTGDEDRESGIWFANRSFSEIRPVLLGSQQYRACVAFPTRDGLIFATDTPLEQNYIYEVSINEEFEVDSVIPVYEINGPCIYGTIIGEKMFFSTSVEPDSSLPKWSYRFTRKLGRGVKTHYSEIIERDAEGVFSVVFRVRKDFLPIWLFQFGNILFPQNSTSRLCFVLQATTGHGKTLCEEKS